MNLCKTCKCKCEKEYCFRHKPRKKIPQIRRFKTLSPLDDSKTTEKAKSSLLMKEFFLEVWNERPIHKCQMCGEWLGNEPLSYMFDHLLEKSKYPDLKYEKYDIGYLCLLCHDAKTRGFPSEDYLKLIENAKKIFKK